MSSTTSASSASSTDSSVSATSTTSSGGSVSNPGMFYKNLFYILIGLLCAFAFVSFLSLARARRRRTAILREAERLGVIVPGIPGYIPMRDRASMLWTRADGSSDPDWWEVTKNSLSSEKADAIVSYSDSGMYTGMGGYDGDIKADELHPLSLIPVQHVPAPAPPVPQSSLPYFPNHLAYRPENIVPPATRFASLETDPDALSKLVGERVDVITIIRMPVPPSAKSLPAKGRAEAAAATADEDDDGEEVLREWAGIELGIMGVKVRS